MKEEEALKAIKDESGEANKIFPAPGMLAFIDYMRGSGYLEALEKAKMLETALRKLLSAHEMSFRDSQLAKDALAKWEKEK